MILFIFIHLYFLTSLIKVVNIKNINYQIVDKKITNSSKTFSLQVLYGSGVEKMNYLRCLYREGDKVTRGSEVEVTFEIPVTLALEFLRGTHVEQALWVVDWVLLP